MPSQSVAGDTSSIQTSDGPKSPVGLEPMDGVVSDSRVIEGDKGYKSGPSGMPEEKKSSVAGSSSLFEFNIKPLWGFTSICGKRPEMEDAFAAVPQFLQVPAQMLMDDHVLNSTSQTAGCLTAHFFGVYDGHGGSQVYA